MTCIRAEMLGSDNASTDFYVIINDICFFEYVSHSGGFTKLVDSLWQKESIVRLLHKRFRLDFQFGPALARY